MREEVAANRKLWDGWTDIHMNGEFYDVEGFIADPAARPFDWVTRGVLGDVTGKRLLHLQSHIGIDTLRLALAGAVSVTGVDFSPRAVAAAQSIARRLDLPVQFVRADVTDLPDTVPEAAFDIVFTSHGTIMWLPELEGWARMIASRLAPGGVFHIIDVHPFLSLFDDSCEEPPLKVGYPYFSREPHYFQEHGSYADRTADFVADSYFWQHTFSEIVGALIGAGLRIDQLSEYPIVAWKVLEFMEQDDDGLWRMPPGTGDIPLMFSLSASRPELAPGDHRAQLGATLRNRRTCVVAHLQHLGRSQPDNQEPPRLDRKALIREYKQTPRPAGLFVVRNNTNNKQLVGLSADLPGMLNRQRFQLEMGSHPDRELQQEWNESGADAFDIEVLDELERGEDADGDISEDLSALRQVWLEKLESAGQPLYPTSRRGASAEAPRRKA